MIFTDEQLTIINSDKKDVVVNAGPGMGKTTLLLGIVENNSNNEDRKITQILCFNSMISKEIQIKLRKMKGIGIVAVNTFHSLALNYLKSYYPEVISDLQNRKIGDSIDYFFVKNIMSKIRMDIEFSDEEIITLTKLFIDFCKSDLSVGKYFKKQVFIDMPKYKSYLFDMIKAVQETSNISIPHEFYIKAFQILLTKFREGIGIDYLLVDEFQDVSPCYLSIVQNIHPEKVVKVGDSLQKIYGYNGAIGINEFDYKLSQSFRIGNDNANFCNKIVKRFTDNEELFIRGVNKTQRITKINSDENKVIIFRKNDSLIQRLLSETLVNDKVCAIPKNLIEDIYKVEKIVIALDKQAYYKYKGVYLRNLNDIKKYAKLSEDSTLKLAFNLIKWYGSDVYSKINKLKTKITSDLTRRDIDVLITAHKCKGMEFPNVELANDFPKISELEEMREKGKPYLDELYVLYVALTRSNGKLQLNDSLREYYLTKDGEE